jgi:chromate reductase, NAD(P)H dehydrogenase (quinone)
MQILALTGSLRERSINTELLRTFAMLAPAGTRVAQFDGLGSLPHFNPDLDQEGMVPPIDVAHLRAEVRAADALLISCPEYAHGVAGSFKNLLDWLVSGSEMPGKPVCVISASAGARFGPPSLVETLRTMSTVVVTGDAVTIPVNGRRLDAAGIAADAELVIAIAQTLRSIAETVTAGQTTRE